MSDLLVDYTLRSLAKYIKDSVPGLSGCWVIGPDFDYDQMPDPTNLNLTIVRPLPFVTVDIINEATPAFSVSDNRLYEQNITVNVSLFDVKESVVRQRTGQLKQALKQATHPITGAMGFILYDYSKREGNYYADAGEMQITTLQTEFIGPGNVDELDNRKYRSHTVCIVEAKYKDKKAVLLEDVGYFDFDDSVSSKTKLTFPATLENDLIALEFDSDATNGVRLNKIVDKTSGGFIWYNEPPLDQGHTTALWEIIGTYKHNDALASVLPSNAKQLLYVISDTIDGVPAFIFKWTNVTIAGSTDSDQLIIKLTVTLAPGDNVSRWSIDIERSGGSSFSIDEIHTPILYLKGPVAPRLNSTHIESQKRTRLLVPQNIPQVIPAQGRNTSLYQLLGLSVQTTVGGNFAQVPDKFQPMGFNAIAAVDSQDPKSYLRCFYIAAEDVSGYLKKFIHQGILSIDSTIAIYHWRCKQYPSFARGPALAATEFGNEYLNQPFKVAIGAFKAMDEAWWYDIAKKYRDFALPATGIARRELNHLSDMKHGNIFTANIMIGHLMSGSVIYQRFLELQRNIRRALDNPAYAPQTLFSLWQNYLQNGIVGTPNYPISESIDEGVADAIETGVSENMLTMLYTRILEIDPTSNWAQFFNQLTMGAYDRENRPYGGFVGNDFNDDFNDDFGGQSTTLYVDYASPHGQSFFPNRLYADLADYLDNTGFYCDSFSGGWGILTYDPPSPAHSQHIAHGGNQFVQGKRITLNMIRNMLISKGRTQPVLMSETPEEGMVGTLELTHEGLCPHAYHGILGEEMVRSLGVTDVHYESGNTWPPLWQAIYNSVVPVGRFVMPLYTRVLATTGSPDTTLYPGLTANEWRDIACYLHSLAFVAGSKIIYQHYLDVDDFMPFQMDGGVAYTDLAIDPPVTDAFGVTTPPAGVTIRAFLRELHSSQLRTFAGQFITYGMMNRPLLVDYGTIGDEDVPEVVLNPLTALVRVHPFYRDWVWPSFTRPANDIHIPGLWDHSSATLPFPVPCVVHSTWTSPEGIVGLVLVNWTDTERSWEAMFNPAILDIAGEPPIGTTAVYTARLVSQGVSPTVIWSGSGPLLISANTHASPQQYGDFNDDFNDDFNINAVYIDKIPPHSVKVITFTPV